MGRVTRSRAEVLLRAPAPDGLDPLERWSAALGGRLSYTGGGRLVDAWLGIVERSEALARLNLWDAQASVVERGRAVAQPSRRLVESDDGPHRGSA
jgi:hypothetical protein